MSNEIALRSFYLLTIRYECKNKDDVTKTMRHAQHTFQGHHEGIIRQLPLRIQSLFPAILSHKSGFSVELMDWIRTLMQNSVGPGRLQKILMEKHFLRYDKLQTMYLDAATSYQGSQRPAFEKFIEKFEEFSTFDDPKKYAGKTPSAMYIAFMYTTYMKTLTPLMDQEVMKLPGKILKGDHSHKYNKRLHPISGNTPAFNGLYTICNEFDEIRAMTIVPSTAMDFIEGSLKGLVDSLKRNGHPEPELFFTDDVVKDRDFLEKNLPSLKKDVRRINSKAKDKYEHLDRITSVPASHVVHVLDNCAQINEKCLSIMEDLDSGTEKLYVGFDTEWTVFSNGTHVKSKVAICQIAYKNCIFICQLSKCMHGRSADRFPMGLKRLIASERIVKVGRSIESADLLRMKKDYGCAYAGFLELQNLCHQKGLLLTPGRDSSLHALVAIVLGKYLPKPDDIRLSGNWDVATLSDESISYAALDAWVGLEIFHKIKDMPDSNKRIDVIDGVESRSGLSVSIFPSLSCSGKPAAYGNIVNQEANNQFFLDNHKCPTHSIHSSRCAVVEVTWVNTPNMLLKCHNSRMSNQAVKDLGSLQEEHSTPFLIVIEKSNLRTATSVDFLLEYPLSPVSILDYRIKHTSQQEVSADNSIVMHPSRVLKDVFHLMDMVPVPRFHSCSKEFSRRFRDALFIINEEDKQRLSEVLDKKMGKKTFEDTLRYHPDWVLRRVRRTVPPPAELLPVVEALFNECKTWIDPETESPLFNKHCLAKCEAVLNSIRSGHVSDPVGINLYQKMKVDKFNLPIYRCMRGTNSVEVSKHCK